MFNSIINDLIINNFFSLKVNLRVIIDYYFKFLILLYSDNYVSEIYLNFNDIYLYNHLIKYNNNLRIKIDEQNELKNRYNKIIKKYNLSNSIKEDYWIKLAIEYNTGKSGNKSIKNIIKWLKDNNMIEETIILSYEENCDFNYVLLSILNKYMEKYPEYKNREVIDRMLKILDGILK